MSHGAKEASAAFVLPLVVLAMGHMLSNAVRTLPAIAADLLSADLGVSPEGLASLTGAYHLTFAAAQVPVGVALDRYGVRPVSLALLLTVSLGAAIAALAGGPWGFLLAQIVMGLGSAGMLITPMTLAAKLLTPAQFGLWSGLIQGLGNLGMLLTASPLAWLVEQAGWRAGFWAALAFGLLVATLVLLLVRDRPTTQPGRSMTGDAREVLRLGASPALRGLVVFAFASFAAVIGVRGLWGGPWLMEVKGLTRLAAGNVLLLGTLALIVGPALAGVLDRRLHRRRLILALGHFLAAGFLLLLVAGGPGGPAGPLPPAWDVATLVLFGLAISSQPLAFALTRAAVAPDQVGKALSAVNLSFFLGAAVLQPASGLVASNWGIGAALTFLALALAGCTLGFLLLTRGAGRPA
ncbi:MFS transporter [Roseomonas sp. OT10]|uniref:MFS transporter n=1 Tax=Roseomonas cutis TaxID=2897332 RepID=UPI001E630CFA|nr:MFS transporter [Roseomonas sp. OT10]UFN50613.1 MFS transporter [Roseomonas sp. OT10]